MTTWADAESCLASLFGGGETGQAVARDLIVAAVAARWRTDTLHDLTPNDRALALQRTMVATADLGGADGDLAFWPAGVRDLATAAFARAFEVDEVAGPVYRLDPSETWLPTHAELAQDADFGT